MARRDDRYVQAIDGKKIPILTLDQKWHRLFTQTGVSAEIKRKEEKVNELLKKQGGLQTRQKDIKRLKNKLMQEVLSSMEGEEKPKGRSREENGKLIEECNEKLEEGGAALLEVEKKLEKENRELMVLSMEVCYDLMQENGEQIERQAFNRREQRFRPAFHQAQIHAGEVELTDQLRLRKGPVDLLRRQRSDSKLKPCIGFQSGGKAHERMSHGRIGRQKGQTAAV